MKRRIVLFVASLLVLSLLLSACQQTTPEVETETDEGAGQETGENSSNTEEGTSEESEGDTSTETEPESDFSFALVLPAARGDRSFIDSSVVGAEKAIEELGVEGNIIETNGVSEHEAALRGAIQTGHDVVLGLAIDAQLLIALAEEYPDQLFGAPSDVFADSLPDNVAAFQINVHESSFLVGLIAGMMTESKKVGAVVGGDSAALNQFFFAYKQGVLEVCPDCEVMVSYLGFQFSDPTLGLETALAQYEDGADIIFQVAGRSGEGVLEAAAQTGNFAIGVDSNQDWIQPGHVIVSMLKRVDTTTFLLVERAMNGEFVGGFSQLGMADGATALSWDQGSTTFADEGPEQMVEKLDEVKQTVEDYRGRILSGEYEVCDALNPTGACNGIAPEG